LNLKPQQVIQSIKRLQLITTIWWFGPGPGEGGLKLLHLWCHSQNTRIPQPKNFFRVQTTRLAASFDTSTRSVTLTGPEIFPRKAMCDPAVFCELHELTRVPKC